MYYCNCNVVETEEQSDINLSFDINSASGDSDSDVDFDIPRHNTRGPWFTVVEPSSFNIANCGPVDFEENCTPFVDLSMKKTKVYLILLQRKLIYMLRKS